MKFKYILILILTFIFSGCFRKSDIQEIDSFKEVKTILENVDPQTLVIFDIDDTLFSPENIYFQTWFFTNEKGKAFHKKVQEYIETKENPKEYYKKLVAKEMRDSQNILIEPIISDIIQNLENKKIKTIALTSFNTGSMGGDIILSLPQWRYEKLKNKGIDFSPSFGNQEIIFDHFTSKAHRHPMFYKGILLTDAFSKGEILGAFLDRVNWKPSNVIFFDDRLNYLESVEEEMKNRGIPFKGYLYKGAQHLPRKIDKEILDIQLQHLKKHNEFISDEEAREILFLQNLQTFTTKDGKVITIEPIRNDLSNDKKVFFDAFTQLYREPPDVMKQALEHFETLEKFLEFAFEDYEKKEFEAHKPDSYFLHALYKNKPVGYLSFEIKDDSAFIRNLAILPTFKGKGIGRKLTQNIF